MTSPTRTRRTATAAYAQAPTVPLQARESPGLPWPLPGGLLLGDLPDINVWLALAVQEHPHHAAAHRYWQEAQARQRSDTASATPFLWFCRTTMLGLVRLLCQPKAVGKGALDAAAAWALYRQYRALPQIGLLTEPADCDSQLHTLVSPPTTLPPRLWTDAYLAALAQASGLRLVSFDRDFERFALKRCWILPTD